MLRDLLGHLLVPVERRLTLDQVLAHPWIQQGNLHTTMDLLLDYKKMKNFSNFSRLKAVVLAFIASQLPCKEIEHLSLLFKQMDSNNDGYLSVDEFERTLKKQVIKPTYNELHYVLKSIDMDKNGKINFN